MATTLIILIIYVIITIGIGIFCHLRSKKTVNDFVLGGRSVNPWLTAFAYGTSYFSAVIFVGYAGQFGWNFGLASTWIGIGNCLIGSLMAWAIMGRRTRVMSKHLDSATLPEFFESRYFSKPLKIISALIVFIFLIPYTASAFNGLSRLFEMAFSVDYSVCVIGMAVITAVYVILGGYKATAYNDFAQGLIMLVGIVAVIVATLNNHGGLFGAIAELSTKTDPASTAPLADSNGVFASFLGPDPINLLGVIILTSLGTWGLPQMVHKFYTIRDERSIKTGTIVSTVFALIVAGGCYFLGGFGRISEVAVDAATGKPVEGFDSVIPTMLQSLPELLIGVVIVLVLSASMSTLSSLVLTSSSTLTLDLILPFKKGGEKVKQKTVLLIMRIFIGVFLLISVLIALNKNTLITELMGYSWGALAGAFLAPFLYGLFWKGVTKASVYASFIFGIGATVTHMLVKPTGQLFGINLGSPVNLGAFTMLCGLVIVPLVSLVTPKLKKEQTDSVFSCFKTKVMVKHGEALSSNEGDVAISNEAMETVPELKK